MLWSVALNILMLFPGSSMEFEYPGKYRADNIVGYDFYLNASDADKLWEMLQNSKDELKQVCIIPIDHDCDLGQCWVNIEENCQN